MLTVRLVVGQGFHGWLYWCTLAMLMGWEAYVAGKILNNWFPAYTNLGLYGRGDWCAGCR